MVVAWIAALKLLFITTQYWVSTNINDIPAMIGVSWATDFNPPTIGPTFPLLFAEELEFWESCLFALLVSMCISSELINSVHMRMDPMINGSSGSVMVVASISIGKSLRWRVAHHVINTRHEDRKDIIRGYVQVCNLYFISRLKTFFEKWLLMWIVLKIGYIVLWHGVSCLLWEDMVVTSIRQAGSLKPQVKVRELRVGQAEIPSWSERWSL